VIYSGVHVLVHLLYRQKVEDCCAAASAYASAATKTWCEGTAHQQIVSSESPLHWLRRSGTNSC